MKSYRGAMSANPVIPDTKVSIPAELACVFASVRSERFLSDIRLFQPNKAARVPGRKGGPLAPPKRT